MSTNLKNIVKKSVDNTKLTEEKFLVNFEMDAGKHERFVAKLKTEGKGFTKTKFFNTVVDEYLLENKKN